MKLERIESVSPISHAAFCAAVDPFGATLTSVAGKLEAEGLIGSADDFLLRAKVFGSGDPVKAGEFLLPAGASAATILGTLQHGEVIRRFIAIPEGLPSVLVAVSFVVYSRPSTRKAANPAIGDPLATFSI